MPLLKKKSKFCYFNLLMPYISFFNIIVGKAYLDFLLDWFFIEIVFDQILKNINLLMASLENVSSTWGTLWGIYNYAIGGNLFTAK